MDRIRIRGGRDLRGSVRVSGSKNGALPILAASLLVDGPIVLRNMPRLTDVENLIRILNKLGVAHEYVEAPGAHSWSYWRAHAVESLRFLLSHVATP